MVKGQKATDEAKRNMAIAHVGNKHTDETKLKMSANRKGIPLSEDIKKKISESKRGVSSGPMPSNIKEKIALSKLGYVMSEDTKNKISKANSGKKRKSRTLEHRRKLRIAAIADLDKKLNSINGAFPNFNLKGCDYLNKLMLETNTFIQHAQNGGEYHIKELGYFLDGYDKENNIAYEIDEYKHFDLNGNLREKDLIRQREIEEYLGCKVIRIKEIMIKNDIVYEQYQ